MSRMITLAALLCCASFESAAQPAVPAAATAVSDNPQLRTIRDRDIVGLPPAMLGDTRIDWQAHSARHRTMLVQYLGNRPQSLRVIVDAGDTGDRDAPPPGGPLRIENPQQALQAFAFDNTGRNPRRARWQLSRMPFDRDVKDWRMPAGLVASGEIMPVRRAGERTPFSVDLGPFLPGGARSPDADPSAVALSSMLLADYPAATLYLRVVALGRNGSPLALPSESIRIDLASTAASRADRDAAGPLPQLQLTSWQPLRAPAADLRCWVRPNRAMTLTGAEPLPEGTEPVDGSTRELSPAQAVNLCDPANAEVLNAIYHSSGSAAAVNDAMQHWGSRRLEFTKEAIRTEMQKQFGGSLGGCTSACRQAIGLAIDQGFATLGGAPSRVFDPTMEQARGYLRGLLLQAFQRHSELGDGFSATGADQASELLQRMLRNSGDVTPPAFEADPDRMPQSPRLSLRLSATDAPLGAGWLQLREDSRKPRLHPRRIPVPPLAAGESFDIPILLASTELPPLDSLQLPNIADLVGNSADRASLMQQVNSQLGKTQGRIEQAYRKALRGRHQIELVWIDAAGAASPLGTARCDADTGDCALRPQR